MRFLRGTPAGDYVYQEAPYEEQVRRAADLLDQADAVQMCIRDRIVLF